MAKTFATLLVLLSILTVVICGGNFVYVPIFGHPYTPHDLVHPITATAELRTNGDGSNGESPKGSLVFQQAGPGGPVFIFGNITGLSEGQHGLSIYEFGDISKGCESLGHHFNPRSVSHGGPADLVRHAGDLGNVKADGEGVAKISESDWAISLDHGPHNIIGRGIAVHANKDDLGRGGDNESLRNGNAGDRIACGVIGLAAPRFHHPMKNEAVTDNGTKPPKR